MENLGKILPIEGNKIIYYSNNGKINVVTFKSSEFLHIEKNWMYLCKKYSIKYWAYTDDLLKL